MAIGALLASVRALGQLASSARNATPAHRAFHVQAAVTLAVSGALAGVLFTALGPLRRRSSMGNYAAWILTVYLILGVVVAVGVIHGDDVALLKEPAIITFLLGSGAATGIFCARFAARRARGDYSRGPPNMRLKLTGALVLNEAVVSCPDRHGTSVHSSCAGGRVARSLSAIR